MYELSIQGDIAAAHFLREYEGKCKDLHGHTWKIEITLTSNTLDPIGMVADFTVLKKQLKMFLEGLDHVCLNDLPYFQDVNPTTENIAKYIYVAFGKEITPLKLSKVKVWESDFCGVTYYA